MNEIINIAINKKLLNANNSRAIELFRKNYKTDKMVDALTVEVSKLIFELIKLER